MEETATILTVFDVGNFPTSTCELLFRYGLVFVDFVQRDGQFLSPVAHRNVDFLALLHSTVKFSHEGLFPCTRRTVPTRIEASQPYKTGTLD